MAFEYGKEVLPLFAKIRCHKADPDTSRRAISKLIKSGKLPRQQQEVFEAITVYPGRTARILADLSGLDYYMIQRRANELEKKGLIVRVDNGNEQTILKVVQ